MAQAPRGRRRLAPLSASAERPAGRLGSLRSPPPAANRVPAAEPDSAAAAAAAAAAAPPMDVDDVPASVSGPSASGSAGEHAGTPGFTRGGVQKKKFMPKVPTRRAVRKTDLDGGEEGAMADDDIKNLLEESKQSQSSRSKVRSFQGLQSKGAAPAAQVAFGYGSAASHATQRAMSSANKSASARGTGTSTAGAHGTSGSAVRVKQEQEGPEFDMKDVKPAHDKKLKAVEAFDYSKYYPMTLPLQQPGHVVADMIEGPESTEGDEGDDASAANELQLMPGGDEEQLLLFQLPAALPVSLQSGTAAEASASADTRPDVAAMPAESKRGILGSLPSGVMGKMHIYESGAVKLQLGDVLFDVVPGAKCAFSQQAAAINPAVGTCHVLGNISHRVVLTPDVDHLLKKANNTF
eukprot:jgi/Chlat1/6931/Chrsp52S06610